jgi:hypothetical protein
VVVVASGLAVEGGRWRREVGASDRVRASVDLCSVDLHSLKMDWFEALMVAVSGSAADWSW